MSNLKFESKQEEAFTLVNFEISADVIEPEILCDLHPPEVEFTKGVVISGRGPIWLYGFLVHQYHPARFVATFDPRLGGAVVVETHSKDVHIGEVIPVVI